MSEPSVNDQYLAYLDGFTTSLTGKVIDYTEDDEVHLRVRVAALIGTVHGSVCVETPCLPVNKGKLMDLIREKML